MPNLRRGMMAAAGAGGFDPQNTSFPDSYVFTWGGNASGPLMQNDTTNRCSPVLTGGKKYRSFGVGSELNSGATHSGGIDLDEKLFMCGENKSGQLGLGDTTDISSPVQVGSLTTWASIITGGYGSDGTTHATKTDGTLWVWGEGGGGRLGDGSEVSKSSPVQIGSLTDWSDGIQSYENNSRISVGTNLSLAIKSDGTMWSWGTNAGGQLGNGNTTSYSSPIQIGAGTDWNICQAGSSSGSAIDNDGKLYAWGNASLYRTGSGSTTYTCVPTQIGSASNWSWVTIGGYMGAAINTDGELYTWGYNSDGQLGLGDTVTRSVPTQVGSLTNWKYIEVTNLQMYGIKTDGTFWSWGAGSATEGNPRNDATSVSSPVQVGSRTDWLAPVRTGGNPMGAWNSAT